MSDVLKVSLQTTIYSLCNRGWSQRPLVTRSGYGGTAPACAFSTRRMEQVQIHTRVEPGQFSQVLGARGLHAPVIKCTRDCSPSLVIKDEMFKLHAIFKDGSVGMKFMTDDPSEAEEMREQWLAFDCVGEVLVSELPRWVRL